MSMVNTNSNIIRNAVDICHRTLDVLRFSQRRMKDRYTDAGEGWNDDKYRRLGDIVNDCDSSIEKVVNELQDCISPLRAMLKALTDYESVNISGLSSVVEDLSSSSISGNSASYFSENNGQTDYELYPALLAGKGRGYPMSRDEANHEKPNPNFGKGLGYAINCQTCVVAYEARLRGYDVSALPNTEGSRLEGLSRQTNLAWLDPVTDTHPTYIVSHDSTSPEKYRNFLEGVVQNNERYTLQFAWGRRAMGESVRGHIISVDRDENGDLRLYDPQISRTYQNTEIDDYLRRFEYSDAQGGYLLPRILRVDNARFNINLVNEILEGSND